MWIVLHKKCLISAEHGYGNLKCVYDVGLLGIVTLVGQQLVCQVGF